MATSFVSADLLDDGELLSGTWGRIELGDFDGAADTLAIYDPLIGIEQLDGDAYDFLMATDQPPPSDDTADLTGGGGADVFVIA